MMKLKIIVMSLILSMSLSVAVTAAEVPKESVPFYADEECVLIAENLIADILDDVKCGLSYADAQSKVNTRIFKAVISNQTSGYGYGVLKDIARNVIFQYRDMYLRPSFYSENKEKVRGLISDVITQYVNGDINYKTAVKNSYEKIYQSVNPTFNYDEQYSLDSCYRDIPAVNGSLFTIARKLLLESK